MANGKVGAPLGNRNATKENRLWSETLRRALVQADGKKLRSLIDKLIEVGAAGDVSALKEIGDRLDGKPTQALTGSDGKELVVRIVD